MSDVVISVDGLGKKYRLGAGSGSRYQYKSARDSLAAAAGAPLLKVRQMAGRPHEGQRGHRPEFWALKDVTFEVKRGEVLGIVGRNGAGKSTLLKILSQITEPTEGEVRMKGRVASLLEVGTGFHPELTGRENVYLNGAILGMAKAEIWRKFDEIVAFAEVEKFVDTPVKHYSSGMYLRLAFSVAAHLEPEILIVDEVLAVGDATFQKKCLGKMEDVSHDGRAVLLVSHNMSAITRLCQHALLLDRGSVVEDGPAPQVTSAYLGSGGSASAIREWPDAELAPGNEVVRLRAVRVRDEADEVSGFIDIRYPLKIEMEYDVLRPDYVLVPNINIVTEEGVCVLAAVDLDHEWRRRARPTGRFVTSACLPGNFFAEGTFIVRPAISSFDPVHQVHAYAPDAVAFNVRDSLAGDSARGDYGGHMPGVVRPILAWENRLVSDKAAIRLGQGPAA